ncbi:hypothetical protein HYS91_00530 [Candidatus Daviesbacteria bacterium]|nr:hypothetical protein [Candidatus Daviesbacteria bacterium]
MERRILGVRIEEESIPAVGATAFICVSEVLAVLRGASVRGHRIPREGPAVLYGPHHDESDPLILYWLAASKARRSIRGVARRDLVDPNYQEDPKVKEWAGNKNDSLNNAPPLVRKVIAATLNIGAPLAVDRLEYTEEFFEAVNAVFASDQMLGIFPQGTRYPVGEVRGFMRGVAFIAHQNPDVPFQAFRIFHNKVRSPLDLLIPIRILLGPPTTFNQVKKQVAGRLTFRGFTAYLEDQVASLTLDEFRGL